MTISVQAQTKVYGSSMDKEVVVDIDTRCRVPSLVRRGHGPGRQGAASHSLALVLSYEHAEIQGGDIHVHVYSCSLLGGIPGLSIYTIAA